MTTIKFHSQHNVNFPNSSECSPVVAKDGCFQHNLLQKLDELIGQVSSHKGLDGHRDLLWILGLRQCCLHNLRDDNGFQNK